MVFGCSENKLDEAQVKKEPVQPQVIWMMPPAGQAQPQPVPVQPMPPHWQDQTAPPTPAASANRQYNTPYQSDDHGNPWAQRPSQPQQGNPAPQSGWNSGNWQAQQQQYAAPSSSVGGRYRPLNENKSTSSGPYPATAPAPASPGVYIAPYDRATGSSQRPGSTYHPGAMNPYGMAHPYQGVAPYASPVLPGYYGNNMIPGTGWPMTW
jgi:hypothetical protein